MKTALHTILLLTATLFPSAFAREQDSSGDAVQERRRRPPEVVEFKSGVAERSNGDGTYRRSIAPPLSWTAEEEPPAAFDQSDEPRATVTAKSNEAKRTGSGSDLPRGVSTSIDSGNFGPVIIGFVVGLVFILIKYTLPIRSSRKLE